ncbi:uncharacterized protein ACBT44_018978 isoform 1-T1 [Syngnathus typhle]
MDKLLLLTSRNTDFSRSAALCFVETWLSERTPHHAVELAGFRLMRADRSAELSGKSKGGGLCFYINERWCTDVTVLKEFCSPLLETLFINCRPFYSPREFFSIVMAAVYIPPHTRASEATQMLADQVTDMENLLPNSLIIILGDLNRSNLAHKLPRYRQHVTCPTRGAQTLDHCYTVIKDAYHSAARAALGLSDHCLVHLIPAYRQKLKTSKPVVRTVRKWTVESRQDLQACFDCTDWGAFEAATSDLHELTDTVTSYISFCEDLCVQTKTFCTYNNDKPWFTPNLRRLRKVKEEAYRSGDRELFRQTRNTLNREVRKARRCYGENLKRHLSANPDPSTVWKGLQSITGYKKRTPCPVESPRLANQLNKFYCRFDRSSHTTGPPAAQSTYSPLQTTALFTPLSSLSPTHSLAETAPALQVREEEVRQMFRRQKTRKAPGPDGVSPSCLKVCAEQLAPTFARIFNRSLELCEVPSCFKSSTIVPVAKNPAITDTFKFLGTTISWDLKWTGHIDSVRKKAQQRLYFLRQLKKFNLPRELLKTFYTAIIQSVLCTSITVWFGSASKQDKHRVQRIIRSAEKIIGINLPSIQDLYLSRTRNRARNISTDPSHPGCSLFELLPSGRRYRARYAKTSRHSFFPQAVALMNSHHS